MAKTAATATRIQKVAGRRSRFSRACLRQTSVRTLMTDIAAASRSPMGERAEGFMCGHAAVGSAPAGVPARRAGVPALQTSLRHQLDRAQDSRGQRLNGLHVLRLEAFAIFGGQLFVVGL